MVEFLQSKMPSVIKLLKKHKVTRAYAFGSVVKGDFKSDSDIDLLIAFDETLDPIEYGQHYFDLAEQLEELLQRPVDLVTEASLKNPYFIKNLNETKVPLYE
ncbi:MAG TPA: nucleotidyltransferase domain-containing protein [Cyclobacteriaceae bacterium]|jgi:predicted nucleotidyltransferase|nr:nucleotidyltransferase domain-containing protein [Cyclobacteriaceae bacterium]